MEESPDSGKSSLRLEVTFAVGYQRKRARIEGIIESRLITIFLLIAGTALVFLFVLELFRAFSGR